MRNFLGRVDTNGVVDTFTPTVTSISGVNALALQADGKIVVGGTWTFYTLDLNGDGRDDFFLYNRVNGTWVEAFSQAGFGGFDYPATGQWDPGWQVTAADLNGDRRTDLFLLNAAGVHVSALSAATGGFNYVAGAPWTPGWSVAPGDLNNDGNADLFLYNAANGVWAEAFSDGAGDFTYATGVWDPGWSVTMTDFNADGSGDLLLSRADGTLGPGDQRRRRARSTTSRAPGVRAGRYTRGWAIAEAFAEPLRAHCEMSSGAESAESRRPEERVKEIAGTRPPDLLRLSSCKWALRNPFQLPQVMDLMAGHLMDDPVDRQRAVLGMGERRRAIGGRQALEQQAVHPREREERVERLAAAEA